MKYSVLLTLLLILPLLLLKIKYQVLVIQSEKTDFNTKINKIEKKITDHGHSNKHITTQEFNALTAENFTIKLKQANLTNKGDIANLINRTDFGNKLKSFKNKNYFKKTTTYICRK